ncbi:LysR family transcriptional regulator [Clostridium sp.]|uniref:LysR family transcriptional regulator n=1 Tax=Clostridium sp. TaxID=1506 RepID=UPI001A396574|nr:LysR family transcriptional regulator [Clostridium sp.]MBK5237178.1 LysR family transcriptional regulator [Clostridium sp.]
MDFRKLQYMLKVAEEKSFSKAAQKLYIAQPSLSQYIQKLEQQLGVQLFDRSTNPLRLTYAGELYAETAKNILNLKDQLTNQMEDISNLKKGRLTIGLTTSRSTYVIPKVLPLFHEKYPGIDVVFLEGNSVKLENLAIKGITDISIMTLPIKENLFSYEPIFMEKILLALPMQHPACKKALAKHHEKQHIAHTYPEISLHELRDEPFILLKQHQKLHQIAIDLCKQAGFSPKVILESGSIEATQALVSTGMGIAFIPDSIALSPQTSIAPTYFQMKNLETTRTLVICYIKKRYLSRASQEFISIMKDVLGEFETPSLL